MQAVLDRDEAGLLVRKAGVMAIGCQGGDVAPGDPIRVEPPAGPFEALVPV
jgi:MOSC domain-containing protein YiiM